MVRDFFTASKRLFKSNNEHYYRVSRFLLPCTTTTFTSSYLAQRLLFLYISSPPTTPGCSAHHLNLSALTLTLPCDVLFCFIFWKMSVVKPRRFLLFFVIKGSTTFTWLIYFFLRTKTMDLRCHYRFSFDDNVNLGVCSRLAKNCSKWNLVRNPALISSRFNLIKTLDLPHKFPYS
jgi:hypothetical protein